MSFYRDLSDKPALQAWNTADRAPYDHLAVSPLAPTIGARVTGIDLAKPLAPAVIGELRRALHDHLVLALPGQDLTAEDHKRLGRYFGTLHSHLLGASRVIAGGDYDPEVLSWRTGAQSRFTAGDAWHADVFLRRAADPGLCAEGDPPAGDRWR